MEDQRAILIDFAHKDYQKTIVLEYRRHTYKEIFRHLIEELYVFRKDDETIQICDENGVQVPEVDFQDFLEVFPISRRVYYVHIIKKADAMEVTDYVQRYYTPDQMLALYEY